VLCADHHPGYSQPIRGGIAYEEYVSPSGVGYDIGCGNKAARADLPAAEVDVREIMRRISLGMGVPAQDGGIEPQRKLARLAADQLGRASRPTRAATWSSRRCSRFSAPSRRTRCTTMQARREI
jgi:RNA-splicing ligase RtcB